MSIGRFIANHQIKRAAGGRGHLETDIKVLDLLLPYSKGGKVGLFGGAGVGKPF